MMVMAMAMMMQMMEGWRREYGSTFWGSRWTDGERQWKMTKTRAKRAMAGVQMDHDILYSTTVSGSSPHWYPIVISRSRLFRAFGEHFNVPLIDWPSEIVSVEGV